MSSHTSVAAATIAAVAICFTLTGCSSAAKNTAAAGSNTPAAGPGSTASSGASAATASGGVSTPPAPPAAGSGKQVNVCTVLPLSTVVAATGRSYSTATASTSTTPVSADHCTYGGPDSALLSLDVSVFYGDPDTVYQDIQAGSNAAGETMTNVSGFGDKAFTDEDDLAVVYGSDVIAVQDSVSPPGAKALSLAVMEQLVSTIHSAM